MNKRVKELEERVRQLEDVTSNLLDLIDNSVIGDDGDFEALETIEDARAVWLRQGEIEWSTGEYEGRGY
jgi:hypothetical protein